MQRTTLGNARRRIAAARRKHGGWARAVACVGALGLGLVAAGCGSSERSETTTARGGGDASAAVAAARAVVDAGYAGTDRDLPRSGPAAVRGKNVWVISCSQAAEGCQAPSDAFAEAGRELGWRTTVADAKLDPAEANRHIRSAISAKADAIVLVGSVSCDWAPGSLQEAKRRGILVYGLSALDCDENGGEAMFDAQLRYGRGVAPYVDYVRDELAGSLASYVTVKTGGEGDVILLDWDDGGMVREMVAAIAKELTERCPGCTIRKAPFTAADLAQNRLQAKVLSAIGRNPDAKVVVSPIDGPITLGAGAAVAQANAEGKDLMLTGWEGFSTNLEMIASGGPQNFAVGVPGEWRAWAAADGLNRLFAGEEQVDAGIGFQLIDAEHPAPANPYDGNERSAGYADNYRAIWAGERG
ncbi:sugar ABC transporter substrate-binding protein [Conexibacter arvalis]|uniref:Ribose transport system substrate-binding protein n=1 Tax=Conexibacter arvalis TaxID=912552 RepID=A0A840I7X8_9ACTN|nr:substrate-binding domain-containing protein [Conexibacter arvalis]MBB4660622.1 ribose transport system substrate-binding protein [Conexibacter arvalis]